MEKKYVIHGKELNEVEAIDLYKKLAREFGPLVFNLPAKLPVLVIREPRPGPDNPYGIEIPL